MLTVKAKKEPTHIGDFGGEIVGNTILFPKEIFDLFGLLSVQSLEEFLSYAHSFPMDVAMELGWKTSDVKKATKGLGKILKGHVHDHFINPPTRPKRVLGALPPKNTKI